MFVIIWIVFGIICAFLAASKGRSAVGWFFIGFFFSLIGLIVILIVSDLKKEEAQRRSLENKNRRLREQVRKERMIADRRHRQMNQRLQAHDRVLGVDTAVPADDPRLSYDDQVADVDDMDDYDTDEDAPPVRPRHRAQSRYRTAER